MSDSREISLAMDRIMEVVRTEFPSLSPSDVVYAFQVLQTACCIEFTLAVPLNRKPK